MTFTKLLLRNVSAPYRVLLAGGLLVWAVMAIYGDLGSHKPIPFDDLLYVTGNYYVLKGLTWDGVCWAFTNVDAANWHPLTWLSHMVDQQLFDRLGAQMLENAGWHVANVLLAYVLMWRLFAHRGLAFGLALVFACHPQNVETVAWLSQRKSLLSTFFLLGTILIYLDWRECRRVSSLTVMITAYVASLMSKAMGVTLPAILFIYELIVNKENIRIGWLEWRESGTWRELALSLRRAFILQLPFLLTALVIATVTFLAQADRGAVVSMETLSVWKRVCNAAYSLGGYLNAFIVPADLCFFYPFNYHLSWGEIAYGMLLLPVAALFCVCGFRRYSLGVFGLGWFLISLLPVIGLIQVGSQSHADRYMYFPMLGLLVFLGDVLVKGVFSGVGRRYIAATGLLTAFALGMGAHAYDYVGYWRDAEVAYRRSLAVGGTSYMMVGNLASYYSSQGFAKSALTFNKIAYDIRPSAALAVGNMAGAYMRLGKWTEAAQWYGKVVEMDPKNPQYAFNYGLALNHLNRDEESEVMFLRAKALLPDHPNWDNSTEYIRAVLERRIPISSSIPVEPGNAELTAALLAKKPGEGGAKSSRKEEAH